ncbi:tetratricopeptide repeat protein [Sphingopyxis alaskensis]|jgi:tetratricopeptide (TPR) repeat protein|uniref:DUF1570 domain-containing protein n=1 Tax=Sphingopyxis alaskensis (strain DSM 13593 / LMG 18877 / RB2256) TaxID=317655 RepID=Q1GQT3_SPHAL|nr:hypothetical protein [Sphingopyxis alaskensis]ABF53989.1 conserved hypothetical protein [Sphingopyxis alaskensis RB2256]MCM3418938.1 hypothetical protein [Sphingopyxis alaskensis]
MRKATIAVMALIAAMTTTGAEAKWLRADTDNFIIYSESSERSLRSFAEKLQRFDATLRVRLRIPGGKEPNRLTIYLVPRAADAGRLATGESGSSIAGFYSADLDGSFAVSHREVIEFKGTSAAQQTLFHEYTHHFMKRYFAAAFPAWFIEGFAEFYSTADFTGKGQYQVGRPAYFRAHGLINMPRIPVADLLLKKPREMRSSGQMDVYYGRAWLLTHMLYYHPDRAGQLTAYIDAINRGEDGEKAAVAAFGDLVALDRDLQRYLGRPLTFMTSAEPIPVPGTVTVTVLPNAEDALLQWRLERRSARGGERLAEVRDELRKLTAEYGDSAGIWYELARAEWDLGDEKRDAAAARAAVDKALAIEPKHVRANILLGEMMIHDLGHRDTVSNADWVAARQPIILANNTDPDDPVPLYAYYDSFLRQGITPPKIAVTGLERAFALGPESADARIAYALALAHDGDLDRATRLAKVVAFDPHDDGQGERILAQIESMRERSGGTGKGAAAPVAPADADQ